MTAATLVLRIAGTVVLFASPALVYGLMREFWGMAAGAVASLIWTAALVWVIAG